MKHFVRSIVCGILGACSAAAVLPAFAQKYPTKPIEVTVHTSAGSGGDIVSRAVAEVVRRENLLPQALIVSNRVGGAFLQKNCLIRLTLLGLCRVQFRPVRHGRRRRLNS
jgi:hypothetical protein